MHARFSLLLIGGLCVAIVFSARANSAPRRLSVESTGADSPTCGRATEPCRSISRAISNAVAGDFIMVGPGIYGDVDSDGFLVSPGDEVSPAILGIPALIHIDRPVILLSTHGASVTRIDAATRTTTVRGLRDYYGIATTSNFIEIGRPGQGFTISGTGRAGIGVFLSPSQVRIAGNIITHTDPGIEVHGSGVSIIGNVALETFSAGFDIHGEGSVLMNNVAQANGTGFLVDGTATVTDNLAINNVVGFQVGTGNVLFQRNSAISNLESGIVVSGSSTIRDSNIYGNGQNFPSQGVNCGIRNQSGRPITAIKNFWGAPTGPGTDPADTVCNEGAGSSTNTSQFRTAGIALPVIAIGSP